MRIVCRFSCGAASAVATKLMIAEGAQRDIPVVIYNAFVKEEHPDNRRFLADCEAWFEHPITVLRNEKYHASTHEVWLKKRYIKGQFGAPCSKELKRDLLDSVAEPGDIDIVGFTLGEEDRLDSMLDANAGRCIRAPLIERNLTKEDCYAMVDRAGLVLPMMYRLGYSNANCIGCPKGGAGYWNKIRRDFPEDFNKIADIQEGIGPGAKFLRNRRTGERIYLRELDPTHGRMEDEPEISCSFYCLAAEDDIKPQAQGAATKE